MQRLTTKEPTEDMLEVAIISIKCALREDFPEFREFYENREWEKKEDTEGEEDRDVTEEGAEQPATENAEGDNEARE